MNNKLNNMLKDFLKDSEGKSMDEINDNLKDFFEKYNNNEIEYKNTPLDDAYELLEKAERSKTEKEAVKLAKSAYKLCPDCFDALLFLVELEESELKKEKLLNDGLEREKKRLEEHNFFNKENIGSFYGLFETRPYIRGLYFKAYILLNSGKMTQAKEICKEILRLNESDNTGARYLLMAIYAVLEDEKGMLALYKKYPEKDLEMLFPLFALYYKLGNDKKAKKYLTEIDSLNPNFIKFFRDTLKISKNITPGYYSRGDASEVLMYFDHYRFLILILRNIDEYILDYFKNK